MESFQWWRPVLVAFVWAWASLAAAQAPVNAPKRPFTFEDMMALKRIGEPVVSPDGNWVVFAAIDVNLEENTRKSHLWIVPAEGGGARRLTTGQSTEDRPRFAPDGKRLIYTSTAGGTSQIWAADFDPASGSLIGNSK